MSIRPIACACTLTACFSDTAGTAALRKENELLVREREVAARERDVDRRERGIVMMRTRLQPAERDASSGGAAQPPAQPQGQGLPLGKDELIRCVSPHANELMFTFSLQWGRIWRIAHHDGNAPFHQIANGGIDVTTYDPAHRRFEATGTNFSGGTYAISIHGDKVSLDVFSTKTRQVPPYTEHVCVFQPPPP